MITETTARALSHPLRGAILRELGDPESALRSPGTLADGLDEPLANVAYHVRVLDDLGLIRCVRTRQVRGALEHIYRLTPTGRELADDMKPVHYTAAATAAIAEAVEAEGDHLREWLAGVVAIAAGSDPAAAEQLVDDVLELTEAAS